MMVVWDFKHIRGCNLLVRKKCGFMCKEHEIPLLCKLQQRLGDLGCLGRKQSRSLKMQLLLLGEVAQHAGKGMVEVEGKAMVEGKEHEIA